MNAAHLINEEIPIGLQNQAGIHLGVSDWGKGKIDFGIGDKPPTPLWGAEGMARYCGYDTGYTYYLRLEQIKALKEDQRLARLLKWLMLPGLDAYTQIEMNGIWCNREQILTQRMRLDAERQDVHIELLDYVPVDFRATADFNSAPFLRRWIYGEKPDGLGLKCVSFTDTGLPSADEATLIELNHPATNLLLKLRGCDKQFSFFDQWEEHMDADDRIHPRYNLAGPVTGRRSSDKPNLQQVPRLSDLRSCFAAPPGWVFLEVDYSAIEVRVAAWLADEQNMLRLFREGIDPYKYVVAEVLHIPYDQVSKADRQSGKAVVLGFQYGLGEKNFGAYAKALFGVEMTRAQSKQFRDGFFKLFPGYAHWHDESRSYAKKYEEVESPFQRVRHLKRILSNNNYERSKAERQAINSPVQGTGGDLTLCSVIELTQILPPEEALIVGDVHDALLFQIRQDVWPKWAEIIMRTMERPALLKKFNIDPPIRLKVEGKIGQAWGTGHEFSLEHLQAVKALSGYHG